KTKWEYLVYEYDFMSNMDFLTSPSPPPHFHCDYSDWSPSFSIIPSVYLLAFLSSHSSSSPSSIPRSSRSLTDSLIASLALADLCFLVTLPLWAVYTAMGYHWPFGQPLCQISSFLTALNMYASVFSLSMLSVERYWVLIGRRHSGHHAQHGCRSRAVWIVGGVWALAGVLALPGLLLRSTTQTPDSRAVLLSCQMDYSILIEPELDEERRERAELWWTAALSLKSTLIGFLFPLIILLVCYCSLAHLLSRHFGRGPRPDRRRQRRLLRVIVTLVMAFFLCWLPLHVNKTLSMLLELGLLPYSCSFDQVLLAAHPYVTCLAYLNSCLNPLLYAACDSSFRKRCRGALLVLSIHWFVYRCYF
uniref:Apelin receptor 2 n=1 Tax=Myripristis murdjan TaxID=586833 RepID=A0A667Y8V8_9TELE